MLAGCTAEAVGKENYVGSGASDKPQCIQEVEPVEYLITQNYTEQLIHSATCQVTQPSLGQNKVEQIGPYEKNINPIILSIHLQLSILVCAIHAHMSMYWALGSPRLWQQKHLAGKTLLVLICHHCKKSKGEDFSESVISAYYSA